GRGSPDRRKCAPYRSPSRARRCGARGRMCLARPTHAPGSPGRGRTGGSPRGRCGSGRGTGAASTGRGGATVRRHEPGKRPKAGSRESRSEEHTSELQSRRDLVCRLLLEKKKNKLNLENN